MTDGSEFCLLHAFISFILFGNFAAQEKAAVKIEKKEDPVVANLTEDDSDDDFQPSKPRKRTKVKFVIGISIDWMAIEDISRLVVLCGKFDSFMVCLT